MGFSPGPAYAISMHRAPQELRTYFVTTVTAQRRSLFQVDERARLFLDVLQDQRAKARMHIHCFVVMPDHVHLLLTPACDVSLEKAMQFIKDGFSFRLKSKLDVWERSFNETQILAPDKFAACKTYIEQNPVRAGLAIEGCDFPYGSALDANIVDPTPLHLR
jgi:putative transposase